jgi:Ser/Thr protein kinase RdoA (MazF antagonist)
MAAEIPVVGALSLQGQTLHHFAGFAFSVSPRRGGRRPELEELSVLEWIGRFLARIHTVGAAAPFAQRPARDIQSFVYASRDLLLAGDYLPLDMASRWRSAFDEAMQVAEGVMQAAGPVATLRLHGDCHPGNILWTPQGMPEAGPHFVDLDDARMGPAVQDLWMLLHGDEQERRQKLFTVLEGYESMRPFDMQEVQWIEPLRTLRIIHYSAWLASRQDDPAFPMHFPWFGTADYWRGQCDTLREQMELMA